MCPLNLFRYQIHNFSLLDLYVANAMGDGKHDVKPQSVNMYIWAWNAGLAIVPGASDVYV